MKVLPKIITLFPVSLILAGLLSSCGGGPPQDNPAFPTSRGSGESSFPVIAVPVVRKTISEYLEATTTLEAERQIDVPAASPGQVTGVFTEVGQRVTSGEVLASLDRREILLEVKEAELNAENYASIFARTVELMKTTPVSKEEYERQKYQLEASKIQLQRARIKLENTEIRSPIEGIITARWIDVGTTVSSNQKVFSVGDFDPLFAFIHIPERDIDRVKINQGVTLESESLAEEEIEGFIKRIDPVVDSASGTVKILIQVSAPAGRLRPGMFVILRVPIETRPEALVIPKKALVFERDQELVFVIKEGVARQKAVELGLSERDLVQVLSGLQEGETVITVGQEALRDGAKVRLAAGSPGAEQSGAQLEGLEQESGAKGGDSDQLSPERLKRLEQRLLSNPAVKAEYENRLKADPELATDHRKREQFFREQLERLR